MLVQLVSTELHNLVDGQSVSLLIKDILRIESESWKPLQMIQAGPHGIITTVKTNISDGLVISDGRAGDHRR
jgi:hypothetical protein